MHYTFKEELLRLCKIRRNPGMVPCIFGVPLTMCAMLSAFFMIKAVVIGDIRTALGCLLGVIVLGFLSFLFGWAGLIDYIIMCRVIKKERYATVRAECKSKKIDRKTRYSDLPDMEDYGELTFENKSKKYFLQGWSNFSQFEIGKEYLLIIFEFKEKDIIIAIFNEETNKFVYVEE